MVTNIIGGGMKTRPNQTVIHDIGHQGPKRRYWRSRCLLLAGVTSTTFIAVTVIVALSGRKQPPATLVYTDSRLGGIRIEYPPIWELLADERLANLVVLSTERGILNVESAYIEVIYGGTPTTSTLGLESAITGKIDRLRGVYGQDSIEIVRAPKASGEAVYQEAMATIAIQTTAMPDGSRLNQWGRKDSALMQMVDFYIARNPELGRFTSIAAYRSSSDELNSQADAIVGSILANVRADGE